MLEIPAFVRRRSTRRLRTEDDLLSPVETLPTTTGFSTSGSKPSSTFRRLTKPKQIESAAVKSPSLSRPSRSSLIDLTRKSFDRRSFARNSATSTEPSTLELRKSGTSRAIVGVDETPDLNHLKESDTGGEETMSADMLKHVAKKTSIKNLLCDRPGSLDSDSIDLDAAIHLLNELSKKASPEELVALHKALLPTANASPKAPTQLAETTSSNQVADLPDEAVLSPYSRRRSMGIPGVATRSPVPSKSPKAGSSSSSLPLSQQGSSSPVVSKTPVVAGQNSWTHLSPPPPQSSQTLTRNYSPAELDVRAIGALELGTLRVTNGAATPEPSIISEADDTCTPKAAMHSRTRSEPMTIHSHMHIHADDTTIRDDCPTPRPSNPVGRRHPQRSCSIPGLDFYTDSSEDDESIATKSRRPSATLSHYGRGTNSIASGPYWKPNFNNSSGSINSRLSTILDDESIAERAQSPPSTTRAFTHFAAHGSQSPPASSGSDTSGTSLLPTPTAQRLSPLRSHPRPSFPKKKDSGYASESSVSTRFSSDEETVLDSFPIWLKPKTATPIRKMGCQLETIPSVSDILSSAPSERELTDTTSASCDARPAETAMAPELAGALDRTALMRSRMPPSTESIQSANSDLSAHATGEKAIKSRRKLQKSAPMTRNGSFDQDQRSSSPAAYPSVPDDMSVNFSRRISRFPGTFDPEHAFAAQAQASHESLAQVPDVVESAQPDLIDATAFLKEKPEPPSRALPDGEQESLTESGLQKKKSRFRLRGRGRSKSLARPEVHLPNERDIPTVADTVPQYADIVRAKNAKVSAEKRTHDRSKSRPRQHAQSSVTAREQSHPSAERLVNQRWVPRSESPGSIKHEEARNRSASLPPGASRILRPQPPRGDGKSARVRPQREDSSRSLGARAESECHSNDFQPTQSAPKTPKMNDDDQCYTHQKSLSEPAKPSKAQSKERRSTFSQVFLRGASRERIRSDAYGKSAEDVNNPAYIAARFTSPPPDHARNAKLIPRTVPWEGTARPDYSRSSSERSDPRKDSGIETSAAERHASSKGNPQRSAPLVAHSTNVVSPPKARMYEADGTYKAYRTANAVSLSQITTPSSEGPLQHRSRRPRTVPHSTGYLGVENDRQRWSGASDTTPSPDSLFDRYGGGLDYGWERGSGFSGSAGTRSTGGHKAQRKGLMLSESHGVDLSDVPIFVTRQREMT